MKRNFLQSITTHSAPITTDRAMSFTDLKAKVIVALRTGVMLSEARAYIREHLPSMSKAQKIELDKAMVYSLSEGYNLTVYEAPKNATLSGLTIDRKESPRCYNQLQYMRDLLKGGNKSAKQRSEKKNQRNAPKAEAARIAKAHADAGYLMSLAQALMAEANKLVAKK